jgi:hypothetical protein
VFPVRKNKFRKNKNIFTKDINKDKKNMYLA